MVHSAEKGKPRCPKCRGGHVDGADEDGMFSFICLDCGHEWRPKDE